MALTVYISRNFYSEYQDIRAGFADLDNQYSVLYSGCREQYYWTQNVLHTCAARSIPVPWVVCFYYRITGECAQ